MLATGYLAYTGMNSILGSIARESKPDLKISLIQLLATDMENAENSVRLYAYTHHDSDLLPYYSLVTGVDDKLVQLETEGKDDPEFLKNMDTISDLVERKIITWNEMLPLYKVEEAGRYLDTISQELELKIESDSVRESRNLFQKIFKRQKKMELDEEQIVREIESVQEADSLRDARIRSKERQLAISNSRLTRQFYDVIKRLEKTELKKRQQKVLEADRLADEAYQWIAWFSLSAVISLMLVIFIITRYARKSHKYQQALVKARNEAENLARTKEIFVANVSHELRTPMNVISGFVGQLLRKPADNETQETLQIIQSSADHLVRIVNDILDFSKLDSGKMILNPVHYLSQQHFEEILLLFKNQFEEKNIRFKITLDDQLPEVLLGDPIRLKQILINLIGNAIKFTDQGEVHLQVVVGNQLAKHMDLKIIVQDTGIGIPPGKLKIIFDDFTQAEAGTTQKYGGTGLGLSIVKMLVELHDGTVEVKSTQNEGTTFTCRLHYKKGDPDKVEKTIKGELSIPETIRKLNILVVDDEPYNRKLVATILKKWGLSFDEASNGKEAIERCMRGSFDIVLMDNRMPEMDGLEAARLIREQVESDPGKLAIIYFSAAAISDDQLSRHVEIGITGSLPKPFSEQELVQVLLDFVGEENNIVESPVVAAVSEPVLSESDEPDFSQLYRVAGDDQAFVSEMLEKFMESFESGYELLISNLRKEDVEEAGNIAHKLASPCRHIGADHLLSLLKEIENKSGTDSSCAELMQKAELAGDAYEKVKQAVLEHLDSLKN